MVRLAPDAAKRVVIVAGGSDRAAHGMLRKRAQRHSCDFISYTRCGLQPEVFYADRSWTVHTPLDWLRSAAVHPVGTTGTLARPPASDPPL